MGGVFPKHPCLPNKYLITARAFFKNLPGFYWMFLLQFLLISVLTAYVVSPQSEKYSRLPRLGLRSVLPVCGG